MLGRERHLRAAFADIAGHAVLSSSPLISSGKSETMSPLCVRIDGDIGILRQRNLHIALLILHFHGIRAGHLRLDARIAVFDVRIAVDLAHLDILGVRNHPHRPDDLGGVQRVAVQGQIARQPGHSRSVREVWK
jgi:hypothetical protein